MWSLQRARRIVMSRLDKVLLTLALEALLLLYVASVMLMSRAPAPAPAPLSEPRLLTRSVYPKGFLRTHPELCPNNGTGVKLVVLVASATNNTSVRRAIRKSWGRAARRTGVVVAFAIGVPPAGQRTSIKSEDQQRLDLIQGKYRDTYLNLTLKSISMLKWFSAYCWRAAWLLKVDDDMFVNVPAMLRFAEQHPGNNSIWGDVSEADAPLYLGDKYFAVEAGRLPPFAVGAYLVAGRAVRRLARAAGAEPLLRLEDVFVTGLVARRVHVRLRHEPRFLRRDPLAAGCDAVDWLVVHLLRAHDHGAQYQLITNKRYRCRGLPPY